MFEDYVMLFNRHYMAEILSIRLKTQYNQSINVMKKNPEQY